MHLSVDLHVVAPPPPLNSEKAGTPFTDQPGDASLSEDKLDAG